MNGTRHEELLSELRGVAEQIVTDAGLELVELSLRGSSKRRVLRVDIDRVGPRGVGLEDCQRISHVLGEALDDAELLENSYVLEVSSPGIDRPLQTADDYRRNTGRKVVVTTSEPIGGRKRFVGVLRGLVEGRVLLEENADKRLEISIDSVESARQDVGF
jgi:ribosome maturation factor RimP